MLNRKMHLKATTETTAQTKEQKRDTKCFGAYTKSIQYN